MDDRHKKDTVVSHRILNFLRAGYQGEYTFMRALRELGSPEINDEAFDRLNTTQRRIDGWYEGLATGDCLFSSAWTVPQTFEAKKALEFCEALRLIVDRSSASLREIYESSDWLDSKDKTRRGVAHIARYAFSSSSYSRGLFNLANLLKDEELALRYQAMANHQESVTSRSTACVVVIKEQGKLPRELEGEFQRDARYAASGLAAQAHDLVQVLAPYKGGEAFLQSTFSPSEAQDWRAVNIHIVEAGYWRAYNFTPKAARQWQDSKIQLPGVAAVWAQEGFSPEDSARWIGIGVSPDEARTWEAAGHTFENAAPYIKRGYRLPEMLPKGD